MAKSGGGGGGGRSTGRGGAATAVATANVGALELEAATWTAETGRESGATILADGRVIIDRGTEHAVSPSVLQGAARGGTYTHTHPSSSPFSFNDIGFASRHHLNEIRAVAVPPGWKPGSPLLVYSMKPPAKGWPYVLSMWQDRADFNAVISRAQKAYANEIVSSAPGVARKNWDAAIDRFWVGWANKTGANYTKTVTAGAIQ